MWRQKSFWLLILIGLSLRLIALNQSLWLDEAISANVAKNYSYSGIIKDFSPSDFHPPLFYLTLKAWTSLFGYSEIALRLPSVIFSLVTLILVFRFFGFWPSLLLAVNPLFVYYSQEARMYSLATLFVFAAFLAFRSRRRFLYFVFTFLALSTFYGTVFFFAAVSLYFLVNKKYQEFLIYSLAPFLAVVFWSPLLLAQYHTSRLLLASVLNWHSVLGPANLKNVLLIPLKFTLGRISFYPKILYYLISTLLAVPLWWRLAKRNLFGFIFWVTLAIGFVFSLFTPMFQYFRFLYLLPFLCLLLRRSVFYSLVFLFFSLLYLFIPTFHREDWQTLAASLPPAIYIIPSAADPIKYYRPDIILRDLNSSPTEKTITAIPYLAPIHGLDYVSHLTSLHYRQTKTTSFRQLTVEVWEYVSPSPGNPTRSLPLPLHRSQSR